MSIPLIVKPIWKNLLLLYTTHQHHKKNPTDTEAASRLSRQCRLTEVTGKARSHLAMGLGPEHLQQLTGTQFLSGAEKDHEGALGKS